MGTLFFWAVAFCFPLAFFFPKFGSFLWVLIKLAFYFVVIAFAIALAR